MLQYASLFQNARKASNKQLNISWRRANKWITKMNRNQYINLLQYYLKLDETWKLINNIFILCLSSTFRNSFANSFHSGKWLQLQLSSTLNTLFWTLLFIAVFISVWKHLLHDMCGTSLICRTDSTSDIQRSELFFQ